MDLKYLYDRRQISLFMAENAAGESSRRVHLELADRYSARIAAAKSPHPSADVG